MSARFNSALAIGIMGTLAASPALASHQQDNWPNWYVGLTGSLSWLQDADVDSNTTAREISFDNGWGIGGQVGYRPATSVAPFNNMRFEAEIFYRSNDIDEISFTTGTTGGRDELQTVSYMVNALYDIHTNTQWVPYFGAGIGWTQAELDTNSGLGNTRDDEDSVFSWQFLLGLGYTPETMPQTQFNLGYRYLGMQDIELAGAGTNRYDLEYNGHNFELGAQFRF